MQRLRAALAASPQNQQLATTLARRYIETGRRTGDPRYLGYAQAALSPWWDQPQAPNAVRILRATILQSQHHFAQALADLDAVLGSDPGNAQAWLTRATILQVQGQYDQARKSCVQLQGRVPELVAVTCIAGVDSLNGEDVRSYAVLEDVLKKNDGADPSVKVWAMTLLAEMAERQGNHAKAEQHYRQALALDPSDTYLLGAFADFLLDRNQPADVATLLQKNTRADGLLLRYALALKRQGLPDAAKHIDTLQSRFAAAALRGDTVHRREQARFALHLRDDARGAFELARQNWSVQKEPADTRILLEAAVANNAKAEARPVLAWLKQTGLQDRTLQELAAKLESAG
ncbi:MAG TPA: tetratricopeptide repeat protein [Noviherbaspirillum sp.]|uniref:tetratricopeptide repeat protein n=1 Tax=Noviherbaspirillum sp. TaxID=1926288 RepID=UPI002D64FA99|nr:tetratricopeptide repeat protein [Noviherbaspirillum sp.]HYD94691.1 tetratricopeptide repeat protein [Noviherbaspirillum sp.]